MSLGYPSSTPIYIAAGGIYGGDSRMADLQSRYPLLMSKVSLMTGFFFPLGALVFLSHIPFCKL